MVSPEPSLELHPMPHAHLSQKSTINAHTNIVLSKHRICDKNIKVYLTAHHKHRQISVFMYIRTSTKRTRKNLKK